MLIEATRHPIRYTLLDGRQVRLEPGQPLDLPEDQARTLLAKAAGRVRAIDGTPMPESTGLLVESANCQRPVFWESLSGRILGPGRVGYVAKADDVEGRESFWLCIDWNGGWRWVNEKLLRSREAYERQVTTLVQATIG